MYNTQVMFIRELVGVYDTSIMYYTEKKQPQTWGW